MTDRANRVLGRRAAGLVPIALVAFLSGCGAITTRMSAVPTLDGGARTGFELHVSLGLGWPLEFDRRTQHFMQVRSTNGVGWDAQRDSSVFVTGAEIDHIYWPDPYPVHVRAGLHAFGRLAPSYNPELNGYSFGGHFAVLPALIQRADWVVVHFSVGPEIRLEYKNTGAPREDTALFSVPLVMEVTLLAVGD